MAMRAPFAIRIQTKDEVCDDDISFTSVSRCAQGSGLIVTRLAFSADAIGLEELTRFFRTVARHVKIMTMSFPAYRIW